MSLPAQGTILSIAPQAAKIGSGSYTIGDYTWRQFRAPRVGIAPIQSQPQFPLETGGPIVPTGAYKDMAAFGGDADFLPRAAGDFGYLLFGLMGTASTITKSGSSTGTYYEHHFRYAADSFTIPWMSVRRVVPGNTSSDRLGQVGIDCKVGGMRFGVPNMGIINANVSIIGRRYLEVENPSWTYANTAEDSASVPVANDGSFTIGGVSYPAIGASIDVMNGLTSIQQEMIIGSYFPDDFVPLTRSISGRFIYKYENPDLCQAIYNGSTSGTEFNPLPFEAVTSGGTPALSLKVNAPRTISGVTNPVKYSLEFRANKVTLAPGRILELTAGTLITQEILFTFQEPASGLDYADLILTNDEVSYSWT